MMMMTMSMIDR